MPEYLITRWVAGSSDEVEIDQGRFRRIREAKDGILLSISLEERLAVVLANYHEFEVELFSHGLRWAIHEDWRWESRRDQVFVLNRRLLAFLNALWMYRDHARGEFKRREGLAAASRQDALDRLHATFSSETLLAVCLLRNYCQHKSLGFGGVGVANARYKLRRRIPRSPWQIREFTSPLLAVRVEDLSARRNHPTRPILEELISSGKATWNPGAVLRRAVDRVTKLHTDLRQAVSVDRERWLTDIEAVVTTAREHFDSLVGLCVVERHGRGTYGVHDEIFLELIEREAELRKRNGEQTSLEGRVVTAMEPIPSG